MTRNALFKKRFTIPPGYQYQREGRRELLIHKGSKDQLRRQGLLDPAVLWNKAAQPSHLMGRGEVLLIKGRQGETVVRKYQHGGLLRLFTGDLFFFGTRPFQEVAITEQVKSAGISTLEILAAIMERGWGGWHRGYLITRYLPSAIDLISYLDKEQAGEQRKAVIEKAGEAVKRIHQVGIYHADLHLKNFLVEGKEPKIYLIDFDKSEVSPHLKPSRRMKNLKRLDRSAEKLTRHGLHLTKRDKRTFCHAYASGDREIRPYLTNYLKRYRLHTLLHQWGWWIARILYPRSKPWRKSIT